MKDASKYLLVVCAFLLVGQGCDIPDLTTESPNAGLVKASGPAVYYQAGDGKRYVFPNEKVYFSWYTDFSNVATVTDAELAQLPIGGNVTYKPGVRLVKVTTDPKVYAVGAGGDLRWITTELLAKGLYGVAWAKNVHDVPDAFFTDYHIGKAITSSGDYNPHAPYYASSTIGGDRQSIDMSELPGDMPIYPNGVLVGVMKLDGSGTNSVPTGEQSTVMYDYALENVTDASSTVIGWFDARLNGSGWKKKTNNALFQLLHLQGIGVYTKDASAGTEATMTVVPLEETLLAYYGLGPKAPPFPGIVPVYPSADELIKNQNLDQQTAVYIAYTLDPKMNVFNWYQGQLAKYSWSEVRNEDKDADLTRIYERMVGNQMFDLKLSVGSLSPQDQIANYQTGIIIMYGPSDRPEFQPGAEENPFLYLFQTSTTAMMP